MPSFDHIVNVPYESTFRSKKVEGLFDLNPEQVLSKSWRVDIPVEDREWNIGVIVGPSGSGKTSIGKVAFGEENYHQGYSWDPNRSVIDNFPESASVEDITRVLSNVGFSSPPNWLQPFRTLSNGQQFRVEMARILFDERATVVVDEYSSVIDRTVAKIGSGAIAKTARKMNRRLVLLSCHYDILEWLEPDWIYHVDTGDFQWGSLRRPEIEIRIQRCHHSAWRLFREHHYLSHSIIPHSECYIASIDGEPAGFFAYVADKSGKKKNIIRGHRSVVLPDYQGIGLGNRVSKLLMSYYAEQGYIVKAITSHPSFIAARSRDPDFRLCTRVDYNIWRGMTEKTREQVKGLGRITATFQYVGNRQAVIEATREKANRKPKRMPV